MRIIPLIAYRALSEHGIHHNDPNFVTCLHARYNSENFLNVVLSHIVSHVEKTALRCSKTVKWISEICVQLRSNRCADSA